MIRAYRIVKEKRADQALTGEGARKHGGRWNSPGTRVVYASGSASLAALEMFAHLDYAALLSAFVYFEILFDESQVTEVEGDALPAGWSGGQAPPELQSLGDDWAAKQTSVVLRVPSAVVPIEWNYLVNLLHPDYLRLQVSGPTRFEFDRRLKRL